MAPSAQNSPPSPKTLHRSCPGPVPEALCPAPTLALEGLQCKIQRRRRALQTHAGILRPSQQIQARRLGRS